MHHDAAFATVRPSNQPSIAVLERLGFRPDGTISDEHGDSRVYVQLRREPRPDL
jgi:RimJ/RimL family protein N-acetyltransferase